MDKNNQEEWLALAGNKSRRELEREVKRARQDAVDKSVGQVPLIPMPQKKRPMAVVPVRVNLVMSPTQFARYEKLWEQVRKQRNAAADKVEAMLEIMESYVAGDSKIVSEREENMPKRSARADLSTRGNPPVQIHIHQCPDCARATVQTSKGELEISRADLERAECDCHVSEPNKRNKTSIPPAVRRQVLADARHKCQSQGCGHTRFLEVHHKVPRSLGGTNDRPNLEVLCSWCHKLRHYRKLHAMVGHVKSPAGVYSWRSAS